MSWKIRHTGSNQFVGNLTAQQIVDGLQDGQWETDDEVMGPEDRQWVPIVEHPQFEELAEALDEENSNDAFNDPHDQHIDMNPLIDVCLVLLVFFILATTMAVMEKVLEMPESRTQDRNVTMSPQDIEKMMIIVEVRSMQGKPVFKIDKQDVNLADIRNKLRDAAKDRRINQMVIDAKDVDWDTVVKVMDAGTFAGITKISFKTEPQANKPAGGANK